MVVAKPFFPTVSSALMASSVSSYLTVAQWPVFWSSKRRDISMAAALQLCRSWFITV